MSHRMDMQITVDNSRLGNLIEQHGQQRSMFYIFLEPCNVDPYHPNQERTLEK